MRTIDVDLTKLRDLGHVGVRRAVMFMGLGLNAAHREDFLDYQLRKLPRAPSQTAFAFEFFPEDLPAPRIREFKQEFADWITACGMRELIEAYALMLDRMHHFALVVARVKGGLDKAKDPARLQERFTRRLGIPDKLKVLMEYQIGPDFPECICQLYEARNVLTHDAGIVLPHRCDDAGNFEISWLTLDVFALGQETGIERPIMELVGVELQEETSVEARHLQRRRELRAGERIRFSQQDLWEICYFFNAVAIPTAVSSFANWMKSKGVPSA